MFGKYSEVTCKINYKVLENIFSEEDFNNNSILSYSLKNKKRKVDTCSGNVNDN